jgi:hypothetical protein
VTATWSFLRLACLTYLQSAAVAVDQVQVLVVLVVF